MAPLTRAQIEYLQVRHEQLVDATTKMRHFQVMYLKFHIASDLRKARYYADKVDELLKMEATIKKERKAELF